METINVDFSVKMGKIKPMHAVNNGPIVSRNVSNEHLFKEAGIPYIRNHDAAFCANYGGSHTVDIPAIFPNFDADVNDVNSYDFTLTDMYLQRNQNTGAQNFYRLGVKIEHEIKKYGTIPPKDFNKWAQICEHIIRHYNEGWADGFNMRIEYWEIWNEPDLHKECWQGTDEQYFELYETTAKRLKKCFTKIKVGGPVVSSPHKVEFMENFLKYISERKAPLDFFSWHRYEKDPKIYAQKAQIIDELLKKYGYADAESVLDEWNYVRDWLGEDIIYSYNTIMSLKGASFVSAAMCVCQKSPIDMLMYYDARPCAFNGMFKAYTYEPLKGYYPFFMFNKLYELSTEVESNASCDDIYVCAAADEENGAIMLTYYDEEKESGSKSIKIDINGFNAENGVKAEFFALDEENNAELVKEEIFSAAQFSCAARLKLYTTMLIKLSKI